MGSGNLTPEQQEAFWIALAALEVAPNIQIEEDNVYTIETPTKGEDAYETVATHGGLEILIRLGDWREKGNDLHTLGVDAAEDTGYLFNNETIASFLGGIPFDDVIINAPHYGGGHGAAYSMASEIKPWEDSARLIEELFHSAIMFYNSELSLLATGAKEEPVLSRGGTPWDEISSRLRVAELSELTHTPSGGARLIDKLLNNSEAMGFRSFVHNFSEYLNDIETNRTSVPYNDYKEDISFLNGVGRFEWTKALNMKVFRDYHYIQTHRDIIQNNIAATTREMHNTVVIKYPGDLDTSNDNLGHSLTAGTIKSHYSDVQIEAGTEWTTFPKDDENVGMQFNPGIAFENKKISIYTDVNCGRVDQACKLAHNWLAKRMRPMYRGNLMLTGRSMKPWDRLILNDKYTEMYGPLEVERVVHHFSASTGWITNIIPHACAEANPGSKLIQEAIFANRMDQIYDTIDLATWAITILMALPTGGASFGVAMAGRAAAGTMLKTGLKSAAASTARKTFATSFAAMTKALKTFGTQALKLHLASATTSYSIGELSKLMHIQAGAVNSQLPIFLSPLMYKGAPLVAGMEASEYTTMSIGAKTHWALRDAYDGLTSITRIALDGFDIGKDSEMFNLQGALGGRGAANR